MCHVYGDERFERLAQISNGQIYILRKSREYRTGRLTFRKTRPTPVPIGIRRKPRPDGQPGFLRVDTVHLGDRGGNKGIYLVNIVDEVTQFQHLGAVPRITQHFMVLVLKDLISAFPFTVQAFHADNGSEYINHQVAELLNELHIPTFTKSRPRHSNDNALVESKNGSIVRRWLGHIHVPHALVPQVNAFQPRPPLPPPQFPPALPLPHRGPRPQRPHQETLPAGRRRHTLRAVQIHARRRRLPPARRLPRRARPAGPPRPPTSMPPRPSNAPATNSSAPSARPETPPRDPPRASLRLAGDPPATRASPNSPVAPLPGSGG